MLELLSVKWECGDYVCLLNKISKHVGSRAYMGRNGIPNGSAGEKNKVCNGPLVILCIYG